MKKATYWILSCVFLLFNQNAFSQNQKLPTICNGCEKYPVNGPNSWRSVSHQKNITQEGSMGRVNTVFIDSFSDKSFNTVYAGTDFAGLWKTTNFMADSPSWECVTCTSRLAGIGAIDLAINPENPNEMLLATGLGPNFLLDYGLGVIKTLDGGKTWHSTSLYTDEKGNTLPAFRVRFQPGNPKVVVALSRNEIYHSIDGGEHFSLVYTKAKKNKTYRRPFFNDLLFHPTKPNLVFATSENGENTALQDGGGRLVFSNDGGKTWNDITAELPNACDAEGNTKYERVDIAISASNPNRLAAIGIGAQVQNRLFVCDNISETNRKWISKEINGKKTSWWLTDIEFSSTNNDLIFLASVDPYQMNLNDTNEARIDARRMAYDQHVDVRDWDIGKMKGKMMLISAHDGGISLGTMNKKGHLVWENKNGFGLNLTQFFGLASSGLHGFVGGGTQDLGIIYSHFIGSPVEGNGNFPEQMKWARDHVGDGYDSEVDNKNAILYAGNNTHLRKYSLANGNFKNNGTAFAVGRDHISEVNRNGTIFYAFYASGKGGYAGDQLQRDDIDEDGDGNTSEYVKGNLVMFNYPNREWKASKFVLNRPAELDKTGHRMSAMRLAPTDTTIMYIATDKRSGNETNRLYRIENPTSESAEWIDLSALLTASKICPKNLWQGIADIEVSHTSTNAIWLSYMDNVQAGTTKVLYHSNVKNETLGWIILDKGLPNYPVNKLELDPYTGFLYAGTDVGIYINEDPTNANSEWLCFNANFPVVKVTDLEIDECTKTIAAATFGRGIWIAKLPRDTFSTQYFTADTTINGDLLVEKKIELAKGVELIVTGDVIYTTKSAFVLSGGSSISANSYSKSTCGAVQPLATSPVFSDKRRGLSKIFRKRGRLNLVTEP